jgi:hypothetical protein
VLAVDGDHATISQLAQRDAVALTAELEIDAVVHEPFAVHAGAEPEGPEQIDGSLLEHAGAQASLDVRTIATFDDDRLDAVGMEDVREREAGGTGPDDRDLRTLSGQR